MSTPGKYLIDTSVFIQAHRSYYSFDLCPGFWRSMAFLSGKGTVISLDKVKDEILAGKIDDVLKKWVENDMTNGFSPCADEEVVAWYSNMQKWAQNQSQYTAAAKAEFAKDADAWIIAYAKAKGLTMVTKEVFSRDIKRRIPIPNVCNASEFQIPCMDTFAMLSKLGVRFDWKE